MINFLIKSYCKYADFRFSVCKKISNYFFKKAYSQVYRCDEFGLQYFSKKKKTGINEIIEDHLKDSENVIMNKLSDYIF